MYAIILPRKIENPENITNLERKINQVRSVSLTSRENNLLSDAC